MEKSREHLNAAKSYDEKKQHDNAVHEALLAVAAAKSSDTKESLLLLIDAYLFLGDIYAALAKSAEAESYHRQALKIALKLNKIDKESRLCKLGLIYYKIGCVNFTQGRNLRAIIMLRKSRKIRTKLAKKSPNVYSAALADNYYKLGLIYLHINLVKSAISNLSFAGEIYKRQQNPDYNTLANIYKILGRIYCGRYSAHYLDESVKFASFLADGEAIALHNAEIQEIYGEVYSNGKKFDDAWRSYIAACEAYISLEDYKAYMVEIVMDFTKAAAAAKKTNDNRGAESYIRQAANLLSVNQAPEGREEEWGQAKKLVNELLRQR